MTNQTFFFTNNRLSIIYTGFGFLFLFGGAVWAQQIELKWIAVVMSGAFFVTGLYFVSREYDKEYEQIK